MKKMMLAAAVVMTAVAAADCSGAPVVGSAEWCAKARAMPDAEKNNFTAEEKQAWGKC